MTILRINGQWADAQTATVSVLDRGFLLGDGVFETARVYGGRAFLLSEHLARLEVSAKAVGIVVGPLLEREVHEALERLGPKDGVLRVTLTRGVGGFGLDPRGAVRPTRVIAVMPLPSFSPSLYERGVSLTLAPIRRYADGGVPAHVKSTSYAVNAWALGDAQARGFDDALFLNGRGEAAEATSANLFALFDDGWRTPPADAGILPGLTRATLLQILGGAAREQAMDAQALECAKAVALVSSVREVVPVHALGTTPFDVAPSQELLRLYRAHVHKVLP